MAAACCARCAGTARRRPTLRCGSLGSTPLSPQGRSLASSQVRVQGLELGRRFVLVQPWHAFHPASARSFLQINFAGRPAVWVLCRGDGCTACAYDADCAALCPLCCAAGGWGKPPVDEQGNPIYGDVFGQHLSDDEDDEQVGLEVSMSTVPSALVLASHVLCPVPNACVAVRNPCVTPRCTQRWPHMIPDRSIIHRALSSNTDAQQH